MIVNNCNWYFFFICSFFDTSEEQYNKLRMKVSDITCIQLGLAIFTYDANRKTFTSCNYSFYTYPQSFYKSDGLVHFQTSCVEFLCKHKFDFNKVSFIKNECIVYCNLTFVLSCFIPEYLTWPMNKKWQLNQKC